MIILANETMPPQLHLQKKEKPLVSIITVVHNGVSSIEKTIQSVINQTYDHIDYIIIDGRSSDGTVDVLKKYKDKIAYWISEPDKGISDAFNKGIKASKGEWINFLNCADIFTNNNVVDNMAFHFCDSDIVTAFAKFGESFIPKRLVTNEDKLHKKAMISHQASFIKRSIFDEIGIFDKNFSIRMDYDFWLRALKKYKFKFIDNVIVDYDPNGISGRDLKKFYFEQLKANKKNLKNYNYHNFFSLIKYCVHSIAIKSGLLRAN